MIKLTFLRNIFRGLLRSKNVIKILRDIPCDIIHDLENDADKAREFVTDLEKGKVPKIIKDLPKEALQTLIDMVGIFGKLPSEIVDKAKETITDAAKIFEDIGSGAIISDIEELPNVIVSDVTSAWGELTTGLENDWNEATRAIACFFNDCPVPTDDVHSCGGSPETPSAQPSPKTSSAHQPPAQTTRPSSQTPVPSSTPTPPYPSWTEPAGFSNGIPDGQYSTAWNSLSMATSEGLSSTPTTLYPSWTEPTGLSNGIPDGQYSNAWDSLSMTTSGGFVGSSRAFPGNAQTTSPSNYSNASPAFMRNNSAINRLLLSFIAGSLVFGFALLL